MSNDKTLATVKHGGCVQLADSERERFEAWLATQHDQGSEHVIAMVSDTDDRYQSPVTSSMWSAWQAANAAREGGRINGWRMYDGIRVYSASAHASIVDDQQFVRYDDYLAALSAQPSPGGEDALREAAEFARSVLAEIYATYQVKIGPFASQAQLANVKLGAALAARQPVGDEERAETYRKGWEAGNAAQAVDLGPVRAALQAAEALCVCCASVDGYSRSELNAFGQNMRSQFTDALALIDSQGAR